MKTKLKVLFLAIGAVVILGIASYFPYGMVYEMALDYLGNFGTAPHVRAGDVTLNTTVFRWIITIFTLIVSSLIVLHMWLLRKACKSLNLNLFHSLLTVGMVYVGAMTLLMLGGLWLDFHVARELPILEPRIAFIFVPKYIPMIFY